MIPRITLRIWRITRSIGFPRRTMKPKPLKLPHFCQRGKETAATAFYDNDRNRLNGEQRNVRTRIFQGTDVFDSNQPRTRTDTAAIAGHKGRHAIERPSDRIRARLTAVHRSVPEPAALKTPARIPIIRRLSVKTRSRRAVRGRRSYQEPRSISAGQFQPACMGLIFRFKQTRQT